MVAIRCCRFLLVTVATSMAPVLAEHASAMTIQPCDSGDEFCSGVAGADASPDGALSLIQRSMKMSQSHAKAKTASDVRSITNQAPAPAARAHEMPAPEKPAPEKPAPAAPAPEMPAPEKPAPAAPAPEMPAPEKPAPAAPAPMPVEAPVEPATNTPISIPSPFFNPESLNSAQLVFVTLIYGYVLYIGSNMIGDGSEGLLFFPSVAGMVGSVVVPILGAVPDGMMVLFSGLSGDAQSSITVGVGALAGSTVMLLTLPWFIAISLGSVAIGENGLASYSSRHLDSYGGLWSSGVTYGDEICTNAKIMMITSCLLLIIQIPAFYLDKAGVSDAKQEKAEHFFAFVGLIACIVCFFGYCLFCWVASSKATHDKKLEALTTAIKQKKVTLSSLLLHFPEDTKGDTDFKKICRPFFAQYHEPNKPNLNLTELQLVLRDLGDKKNSEQAKASLKRLDLNNDSVINFDEFCGLIRKYLDDDTKRQGLMSLNVGLKKLPTLEIEDEEEEEVPEDLADLDHDTQCRIILFRSLWNMLAGTALVLLFSDPAVNVLQSWGDRLGISAFYVSFLLAPFASNASELLVAAQYAAKKSSKSITMALSSLVGAACMNNTFCLGIFFMLVWIKGIAWKFKAETLAIILVQWLLGLQLVFSQTQRLMQAFIILLFYPGVLVFVNVMENDFGWD